jgi:asparagine synthase (glutamine-hydrolysing)
MSGVAACLHLDDRPADVRAMREWMERLRRRGPDARHAWADGPVALGHALFQTLPEDRPGRQPATDATGAVTVVFDGRLDNRGELSSRAATRSADISDAALVAAVLAAHGAAALGHLLGEFALLAWDRRTRTLVGARDVFGLRPLAYRRIGSTLWVASEVAALVNDDRPGPDEGFAGEVLSGRVASLTDTLYRGVTRLPPGHVLLAQGGAVRVSAYTMLTAVPSCPKTVLDAESELRGLLSAAVAARLRVEGRAGMLLSGGIDSAAVLASVAPGERAGLWAWTADQRADVSETDAAATIARHLGVTHHVAPAGAGRFDYEAEARAAAGVLLDPAAANGAVVRTAAADEGTRVLLAGVGGDEFFTTNRWHGADLLARGRLWDWVRFVRAQQRSVEPPGLGPIVQATLAPLVPRALRPLARAALGQASVPSWIDPAWARRIDLADRLRAHATISGQTHAGRARLLDITGGASVWTHELSDRMAVATGTEDRWPFFDRRIAEWAMGLPPALVAAAPQRKALLRSAFRELLPGTAHQPASPFSFEHVCAEALASLGGRTAFDHLRVVGIGWVAPAWLAAARLRMWPAGGGGGAPAVADALWQVLAVEAWLRQHEERPHHAVVD